MISSSLKARTQKTPQEPTTSKTKVQAMWEAMETQGLSSLDLHVDSFQITWFSHFAPWIFRVFLCEFFVLFYFVCHLYGWVILTLFAPQLLSKFVTQRLPLKRCIQDSSLDHLAVGGKLTYTVQGLNATLYIRRPQIWVMMPLGGRYFVLLPSKIQGPSLLEDSTFRALTPNLPAL